MKNKTKSIAFGGGCHWCTEALFQSLKGVEKVEPGFVSSTGENHAFSEAVIVHFKSEDISLPTLIEIHLHTHQSGSDHRMRAKYRSAIYTFSIAQAKEVQRILIGLQPAFEPPLITKVLPFRAFHPSEEEFTNYYYTNPDKPFCKRYIDPKLQWLLTRFSKQVHLDKLIDLGT